MAFKILTGTYNAGYTLSPTFSVLSITSTGLVGGTGVLASASATVVNAGTLAGGTGGAGRAGARGVDLAVGGRVNNTGLISGGVGGVGDAAIASGMGGTGGAGVVLRAAGTVINMALVTGGGGGREWSEPKLTTAATAARAARAARASPSSGRRPSTTMVR